LPCALEAIRSPLTTMSKKNLNPSIAALPSAYPRLGGNMAFWIPRAEGRFCDGLRQVLYKGLSTTQKEMSEWRLP